MRSIVFILFLIPSLSLAQQHRPDSAAINSVVERIDKLSTGSSRSFQRDETINNRKYKENWNYFDNKQDSRLTIDYIIDTASHAVACTEKYYFRNGALIYAYLSETFFIPAEGIDSGTTWAGYFYFSNGKLVDHVTLGHGRSELDDWNPEKEVLQKLKKRKTELSSLK